MVHTISVHNTVEFAPEQHDTTTSSVSPSPKAGGATKSKAVNRIFGMAVGGTGGKGKGKAAKAAKGAKAGIKV